MVSCCKLLGVRIFVVRSWFGNDFPVYLYQMNVICLLLTEQCYSVLTRKGKVPRHNFHPPRSQSWLRGGKAQLQLLRARFPTLCPPVTPEEAGHPTHLALSVLRLPK